MSKVFVDNCRSCMLPFQSIGDSNHKQLCDQCYQKHARSFGRIRELLEERPDADEKEIHRLLAIDTKVIQLYTHNLNRQGKAIVSGKVLIISTELSATFQNKDKLTSTEDTAFEIAAAGNMVSYFILSENEAGVQERTPVHVSNPRKGHRARIINVDIRPIDQTSDRVKTMLVEGSRFAIYIEKDDMIIPAELHYYTDRPTQIEMKTNIAKAASKRAQRVKMNKSLSLVNALGVSAKATINDISTSGVSFFCAERIAEIGQTLHSGSKTIVVVGREKLDKKWLYRGYFS